MKRSTFYRAHSRHHAALFIVGLCVVITAVSEAYVSYADHDATGLAMWVLLAVTISYVAACQFKLFRHYADSARRAESAEWRYHCNQSRTLRGFVRNNQKR